MFGFRQFCCKCNDKLYGGTMRWRACRALCPEFAGSIPAPANLGGPPLTKWGSCQSGRAPWSAERCIGVHPGPVYPGYLPVQIRPLREAHLGLARSHCTRSPKSAKALSRPGRAFVMVPMRNNRTYALKEDTTPAG